MQVISAAFIKGKKIILRYDIDVALKSVSGVTGQASWEMAEDFKLRAGIPTLKLCLENAAKVVIIGHLGRPFKTVEDEKQGNPSELSARPIQVWFEQALGEQVDFAQSLEQASESTSKIVLLENIRFFHGEVECDIDFARKLAMLGERYINEAFSSYNAAASTTILPTLMPHAAGVHFAEEVRILSGVRNNPRRPFVAVMGGAKVMDKLPVIEVLAKQADAVLVGGKLIAEIREENLNLPKNVMVGKLSEDGFDIAPETVESWRNLIARAKMIVWNGPLGKFEDPKNDATKKVAEMILDSGARVIIGGGDSVAALSQAGLLQEAEKLAFVSVGGGAMLKFLAKGTLKTIEALQ